MILEEAAYMDPKIVTDVCVPLMTVKYTATLAISTPKTGQNYYSRLFKMKKADGKTPLFNRVQIGLACETCQTAGKATECIHKLNLQPSWKTGQDLAKQLQTEEQFKREQQGLITDNHQPAFDPGWINDWLASDRRCNYEYNRAAGVLFVAIDPCGGSPDKSELSILVATKNKLGHLVVRLSLLFSLSIKIEVKQSIEMNRIPHPVPRRKT